MQRFPRFPCLPSELRIQIWQETRPRPGIHAFNVCIPSHANYPQISQAQYEPRTAENESEPLSGVFFDQITVPQAKNLVLPSRPHINTSSTEQNLQCDAKSDPSSDPSAYLVTDSVRQSCPEALSSLEIQPVSNTRNINESNNSVHLPARGHDKRIWYDNTSDVLLLQFSRPISLNMGMLDPNGGAEDDYTRVFKSWLSDIFLYPWSSEFTSTLLNARRVAIDVAEIETEMSPLSSIFREIIYQEVQCLSYWLQNDLEVLYVVDRCVGRCRGCRKGGLDISSLTAQAKRGLSKRLEHHVVERESDVFYGNGVTFREIFALESLGWSEKSPTFVVLSMFAEAIQEHQGKQACFQGVRVLACQETG
ncbi:hypothetical protein BJX76DRAFT_363543 [Aspergillus varians]